MNLIDELLRQDSVHELFLEFDPVANDRFASKNNTPSGTQRLSKAGYFLRGRSWDLGGS